MDTKNEKHYEWGIAPGTVLFFIFLILKLTDNIDWSWWWVTCPLWAPLTLFGLVAVGAIIVVSILELRGK